MRHAHMARKTNRLGVGALGIIASIAAVGPGALPRTAAIARTQEDTVPAAAAALEGYLRSRAYADFRHEVAPHPSAGPHGSAVVIYADSLLDASLQDGASVHPRNAAAVLERLDSAGNIIGWAVSVKTHNAPQGQGWFWYESVNGASGVQVVTAGWGAAACTACHAGGKDYVLGTASLR